MGKINDLPVNDTFGVTSEVWNRLVDEFKSYRTRQSEYLLRYEGKYLILHQLEVSGAFETYDEAYAFASHAFESETYLIQKCTRGNEEYAINLPPRFYA